MGLDWGAAGLFNLTGEERIVKKEKEGGFNPLLKGMGGSSRGVG